MARLFFALPIPDAVELELHDLEQGIPDARWTFGVGLHLTLAFLGDCSRSQLKQARDVASDITWPKLDLQFDGAGVFPLRGQPKTLWLGIRPNLDLVSLQKGLTHRLRSLDFEIEKRKFHPHVTLARIAHSPEDRVRLWLTQFVGYHSPPFAVTELHLVESTLTKKGPHYGLVDAFECAG